MTEFDRLSTTWDVVVLGGGAAGLMAGLHAAREGARTLILEKTRQGAKKIVISGGGRCNVLPEIERPERFVSSGSPYLVKRFLMAWPLKEQIQFFQQDLGLELALEVESRKYFPASNRATDVRDALQNGVRSAGAFIRQATVSRITPQLQGWHIQCAEGEDVGAHAVIVATGGLSVPNTGSDGFGLDLARRLGHTVHPPYPALTPLLTTSERHARLSGLALTATLYVGVGKKRVETTNGFLFTHRGYSGPAALDLSHYETREGHTASVQVQWEADRDTWEERFRARSGTVLRQLRDALPARLAELLMEECALPQEQSLAHLRKADRATLLDALTAYPLPVNGSEGYKKAEVTGGGVALDEVHPATLESKRYPGLFFSGEVLDAFGPIGGHNFMWAWSTGRTAGRAAARQTQAKGAPTPP